MLYCIRNYVRNESMFKYQNIWQVIYQGEPEHVGARLMVPKIDAKDLNSFVRFLYLLARYRMVTSNYNQTTTCVDQLQSAWQSSCGRAETMFQPP